MSLSPSLPLSLSPSLPPSLSLSLSLSLAYARRHVRRPNPHAHSPDVGRVRGPGDQAPDGEDGVVDEDGAQEVEILEYLVCRKGARSGNQAGQGTREGRGGEGRRGKGRGGGGREGGRGKGGSEANTYGRCTELSTRSLLLLKPRRSTDSRQAQLTPCASRASGSERRERARATDKRTSAEVSASGEDPG